MVIKSPSSVWAASQHHDGINPLRQSRQSLPTGDFYFGRNGEYYFGSDSQFNDVQYQHVLGAELAGGLGSNFLKLEAFRARWERDQGRSNTFNGAYLELGRFLTGQDFNYQKGKFVRPVLEPGTRAWELGLRISLSLIHI